MTFEPDILVKSPGGSHPMLVIEVKTQVPDLEGTEANLKQYMVLMQVAIGALITPERIRLYRDFYTQGPNSVRLIGDYNISTVWRQPPPSRPPLFEEFVQRWLEDLPQQRIGSEATGLREALQQYIIPAIESGEVQAAHPRNS
jgi:hypothetical protein